MRMMDEDEEEEDEEDAGRRIWTARIQLRNSLTSTILAWLATGVDGRRTSSLHELGHVDVLGGVYRGRLRTGLGITTWRRARTDALGSHADVLMFIACLRKT